MQKDTCGHRARCATPSDEGASDRQAVACRSRRLSQPCDGGLTDGSSISANRFERGPATDRGRPTENGRGELEDGGDRGLLLTRACRTPSSCIARDAAAATGHKGVRPQGLRPSAWTFSVRTCHAAHRLRLAAVPTSYSSARLSGRESGAFGTAAGSVTLGPAVVWGVRAQMLALARARSGLSFGHGVGQSQRCVVQETDQSGVGPGEPGDDPLARLRGPQRLAKTLPVRLVCTSVYVTCDTPDVPRDT